MKLKVRAIQKYAHLIKLLEAEESQINTFLLIKAEMGKDALIHSFIHHCFIGQKDSLYRVGGLHTRYTVSTNVAPALLQFPATVQLTHISYQVENVAPTRKSLSLLSLYMGRERTHTNCTSHVH